MAMWYSKISAYSDTFACLQKCHGYSPGNVECVFCGERRSEERAYRLKVNPSKKRRRKWSDTSSASASFHRDLVIIICDAGGSSGFIKGSTISIINDLIGSVE